MARNNYSIIHALKKTTLANSFDRCKFLKYSPFSVLLIPDEVSCIIDETSGENFFHLTSVKTIYWLV